MNELIKVTFCEIYLLIYTLYTCELYIMFINNLGSLYFGVKNCNLSKSSVESFAIENASGVMYCLIYGLKFVLRLSWFLHWFQQTD